MTAAERRQAMLEALCVRRFDSIPNLAFEFGVCRRTAANDVLELSLSYPIYTIGGYGGGVHVMEGFYLTRTSKFNEEQLALLNKIYRTLVGNDKKLMASIIKFGGGRIDNESI